MTGGFFAQAFIYLSAAVVAVPLAKRLGLGSVLGYLLAGVALGPFVLGLVGGEQEVMHFAEFGVVMMLFLIGLELRPSLFWQLRRPILGLGGSQVLTTTAVVASVALAVGMGVRPAIAIGMTLALSSTAIVLQSLAEKGLLKSEGGQASFSVLLFQDIAVILMIALMPLLGQASHHAAGEPDHHGNALAGFPGWAQGLVVLAAVAGIVVAGRYAMRPLFRYLARTHLREVFTAAALLLVVGIAILMSLVGLSPALGTFLAGVVLADSEYRHELESDIEPFKGLLLGLFFISVGASIDFALVLDMPGPILGIAFGLIAAKLVILYVLATLFRLHAHGRWLFTFSLAQGSEFGFVLVSFATDSGVYSQDTAGPLIAGIAISMVVTPLLLLLVERVILPYVARRQADRPQDTIEVGDVDVVVAGFGRFGQVAGRLVRANGFRLSVLDLDADMVDLLRRVGLHVYYGDASRPELLHAAGCGQAKLFILAVDDPDKSLEIATVVRQSFPDLRILARARNREHYYALRHLGIEIATRETFGSAVELGVEALRVLGFGAHRAHRAAARWRRHDEKALEKLATLFNQDKDTEYFDYARQSLVASEDLMRKEAETIMRVPNRGWDNESLRDEVVHKASSGTT
ncbi:MAG: monovalent cation:proton antiporter-2 (CPA2) family protein [Myxococcota bacterium]